MRSIRFSSSRTLPGQSYSHRCTIASSAISHGCAGRCWLCLSRKCCTRNGNVRAPLAQRRHDDRDHLQAIEEILAETPLLDLDAKSRLLAAITRTSTLTVRSAPTGRISRSCSTRSSFTCSACGHLADLVEEDRPAVGQLEQAHARADRAGERAASRGRTSPTRAGPAGSRRSSRR